MGVCAGFSKRTGMPLQLVRTFPIAAVLIVWGLGTILLWLLNRDDPNVPMTIFGSVLGSGICFAFPFAFFFGAGYLLLSACLDKLDTRTLPSSYRVKLNEKNRCPENLALRALSNTDQSSEKSDRYG